MFVFVLANLARGKTATQSSKDAFAKFAVDGIYQTTWIKGYCTHTYMESNPWWRVDLAQVQPVSEIYLVNRGDCCANRLWNVEVRVGERTLHFVATFKIPKSDVH